MSWADLYKELYKIEGKKISFKERRKLKKMCILWEKNELRSPYAELMTYRDNACCGGHCVYFFYLERDRNPMEELRSLEQILPFELKDNIYKAYDEYQAFKEEHKDELSEETILCFDYFLDEFDYTLFDSVDEIDNILRCYATKLEL